jgi:signal transduction histidine kinase
VFLTAYAITKHRLLDIEIVIKRGVVYSSLAVFLTFVYFLVARGSDILLSRITGYGGFWTAAPSIIIIAILFQPTRDRIQDWVDKIMFKKRYMYQKILNRYSHTLTRPTADLGRLSKLAPYLTSKAMNLDGASILILNRVEGKYEVRGTARGAGHLFGFAFDEKSELIRFIKEFRKTVSKDDIVQLLDTEALAPERRKMLKAVIKQMERLDSLLVIPSISESEYFKEPTLLSLLCLGEKASFEPFSADDISFLESLADQATITIEYSIIMEELEKSRERLVQSEKLAALGTMAAGVAHEIKNPLAALKLFTEVIPLKFDDPEYREKFAKLIPSELGRLRRIISDLDNFSKPESEIKAAPFSVKDVLESTIQLLEPQLKKSSVKVKPDFKETPMVMGNNSKMMQVFMNIMLNATHAMEGGGVLTVESGMERGRVRISIADTGSGIPKEKIKDIFNPFFTTKETGTGLGLAITRRIIEEHKGVVDVESEMGKGTKFTISLPVVK